LASIVHVSGTSRVPTLHEYVDIGEPEADPEQNAAPVVMVHVKEYPPEPRLAVESTERVWPWSAAHPDEHEMGDVSATALSKGSWYSVAVNESEVPPEHGLGYWHPLLSAT
jgi:hypothetical protein